MNSFNDIFKNLITKVVLAGLAGNALYDLVKTQFRYQNPIWQALFCIALFIILILVEIFYNKKREKNMPGTPDLTKSSPSFVNDFFTQFKKAFPAIIFSIILVTIIYYDANYNYRNVNSVFMKAILTIVFWFIGLVFGLYFSAPMFYSFSMRSSQVNKKLIPRKESIQSIVNYYIFLIIIIFLTAFLKNNILHITVIISTFCIFSYLFISIFSLLMAIFYHQKEKSDGGFVEDATLGLIIFILLTSFLFIVNHPVMLGVIDRIERIFNWIGNLF